MDNLDLEFIIQKQTKVPFPHLAHFYDEDLVMNIYSYSISPADSRKAFCQLMVYKTCSQNW